MRNEFVLCQSFIHGFKEIQELYKSKLSSVDDKILPAFPTTIRAIFSIKCPLSMSLASIPAYFRCDVTDRTTQ